MSVYKFKLNKNFDCGSSCRKKTPDIKKQEKQMVDHSL